MSSFHEPSKQRACVAFCLLFMLFYAEQLWCICAHLYLYLYTLQFRSFGVNKISRYTRCFFKKYFQQGSIKMIKSESKDMMLQKISNKCCSLKPYRILKTMYHGFFHKNIKQRNILIIYGILIILKKFKNILIMILKKIYFWPANQHIRMRTEDCSNDAENSALHHRNKSHK